MDIFGRQLLCVFAFMAIFIVGIVALQVYSATQPKTGVTTIHKSQDRLSLSEVCDER
ncbi:hypothetical protein [uncultured Roseibium sp.]|uniref:hypothetical protein n=1 Tax=uncultured Roseibium sp. TaxID=1936171 RepID=UPI002632D9D7|nr:hypothetical protein [uncultured Roseibium sp.]